MRIGNLFWQPSIDPGRGHERLRETIELTQLCERLGFDSVVFGENHFSNYGLSPNPVLLAAAIGQHTDRITVGTGIVVLPFWNPVRLAEDAAVADLLLNGRLELGIGRGYQQLEFNGLNIPYAQRQARYDEALAILLKAWTTDCLEHEGTYFQVPRGVNVLPKPLQKPHPRVLVAAITEESVRAAAATDFKVFGSGQQTVTEKRSHHDIYLEERRRLGLAGDHWVVGMNRQVYVIDSTRPDDHERERIAALERARTLWRLGDGLRHDSVSYDRGVVTGHPLTDEPPDLEGYAPRVIFGTPEQVLEQFRALRAQGVQEVNLMTEFGFLDFARTRRSIELFGKEVLPVLRADEPVAA